MNWAALSVKELNEEFSIDEYLQLSAEDQIAFRSSLKECLTQLGEKFKLKTISKDDVVDFGLKENNPTALTITFLLEKSKNLDYDQAYNFNDTIKILRGILLEELLNGKNLFYDLKENTIGLDPNYVPFIVGSKFKLPKPK